jgi:hypothetical protein
MGALLNPPTKLIDRRPVPRLPCRRSVSYLTDHVIIAPRISPSGIGKPKQIGTRGDTYVTWLDEASGENAVAQVGDRKTRTLIAVALGASIGRAIGGSVQ